MGNRGVMRGSSRLVKFEKRSHAVRHGSFTIVLLPAGARISLANPYFRNGRVGRVNVEVSCSYHEQIVKIPTTSWESYKLH